MKKIYISPVVRSLGSVERLTMNNQLDPYSDVPKGQLSDHGNNPPEQVPS